MSGATILNIHAQPNKRVTTITKEEGGTLFLDVHAKPENNAANDEIVRFLSKRYGKTVRIVSGRVSKRKTVRIE